MNARRLELRALDHPWRTVRYASSLVKPRESVAAAGRQAAETARRIATDHAVHAEAQRAIVSASNAARRAQRVGLRGASTDRRFARHLRLANKHASKAASLAFRPRRRRTRAVVLIVVGGGAVAGGVYAGWRKYSAPPPLPVRDDDAEPVSPPHDS
jgi:hypothetical protein